MALNNTSVIPQLTDEKGVPQGDPYKHVISWYGRHVSPHHWPDKWVWVEDYMLASAE